MGLSTKPCLRVATLEQNLQCIRNEFELRGKGKSCQQWIDREKELEATQGDIRLALIRQPVTRDLTEDVLGGCSITPRILYYVNGIDGVVYHVNRGFCLTSVFVPQRFRGRGYGQEIKKQIHQFAEDRDYAFSTLYSAVGEFYAPHWTTYSVQMATWHSQPVQTPQNVQMVADVTDLILLDQTEMRKELTKCTEPSILHPFTTSQLLYWRIRQRRAARHLGKVVDTLGGAVLTSQDGQDGGAPPFIVWYMNWFEDSLVVLRLRHNNSKENAETLIEAARSYCAELKLAKVEARDADKLFQQFSTPPDLYKEDLSNGAGLSWHRGWRKYLPSEEEPRLQGVKWLCNEMYPWA